MAFPIFAGLTGFGLTTSVGWGTGGVWRKSTTPTIRFHLIPVPSCLPPRGCKPGQNDLQQLGLCCTSPQGYMLHNPHQWCRGPSNA